MSVFNDCGPTSARRRALLSFWPRDLARFPIGPNECRVINISVSSKNTWFVRGRPRKRGVRPLLILSALLILTIIQMLTSASKRVCLALALFAIALNTALAGSVTLAWRPSPSQGIVAYKLYYGTSSSSYEAPLVVPNATVAQINGLVEGTTYHFVATAVTATGEESPVSNEAQFTVPASQPADSPSSATGLANISTRADVCAGETPTIAGFVIPGIENHTVLVRALGPTLTSFGIHGALANPFLALHYTDLVGHDTLLATNDNWKDTQQDAIKATGLAPSDDTEAAIIQSLAPGTYTAVLTDADGGSGVGLIEVYDLSMGTSLLFNISTRGFAGIDDHALIAGFIAPSNNTRVVVRALGPTLQQFGIAGALSDPVLMLFDENGNLIASNDNWGDSQANEIETTGYAPPDPAESAITVTRPAGNTTAIVRGKNRGTGVALVEVYYLPL
jgi:hypothetical protein